MLYQLYELETSWIHIHPPAQTITRGDPATHKNVEWATK